MLAVIGFITYAVNEGGKIEEQEAAHPTCVSDYTKCSDNKDPIEDHESKDHISMAVECEEAAKESARYERQSFRFSHFGPTTLADLISNRHRYFDRKKCAVQKCFEAAEHMTATCFHDLIRMRRELPFHQTEPVSGAMLKAKFPF